MWGTLMRGIANCSVWGALIIGTVGSARNCTEGTLVVGTVGRYIVGWVVWDYMWSTLSVGIRTIPHLFLPSPAQCVLIELDGNH